MNLMKQDEIEVDRLRIWDFYLTFPNEARKITFPGDLIELKKAPKDIAALNRLEYDVNHPEDLIEIILNNHVFELLWTLGFFGAINKLTGFIIDDFENESIIDAAMIKGVRK